MDDATLALVVVLTIIGFVALAAVLLVPVYRFLQREKAAAEAWNQKIQENGHTKSESVVEIEKSP